MNNTLIQVPIAVVKNFNVIDTQNQKNRVVGELAFHREAIVSNVEDGRTLLAPYGPIQFDCDCETNKRIDFQICEPIAGKDVSEDRHNRHFKFKLNKLTLISES